MDFKDEIKPPQIPTILPFPVENQQPQMSIRVDDTEIGNFYLQYYSTIRKRCRDLLGNDEDAEDIAHDVFKKIQELESDGRLNMREPGAYLYMMATNMSRNKKKRARRELKKIHNIATSLSWSKVNGEQECETWEICITDKGYDLVEAKIIVQAILDEQDEVTRNIYIYKYIDDMTLNEIGEVVGLRKSAVQKRIKKLEEQLRVKIGRAQK